MTTKKYLLAISAWTKYTSINVLLLFLRLTLSNQADQALFGTVTSIISLNPFSTHQDPGRKNIRDHKV